MRQFAISVAALFLVFCGLIPSELTAADAWPELPLANGVVKIPAQEWPLRPGPRQVPVTIHYPGGKLANITEKTGLMLSLHNWGGTGCAGTANPVQLAERFNVVCLCVDYLQSGVKESVEDPEPYDFGYLQALDALRALSWLESSLGEQKIAFAKGRVYATGGSGGGNVTLMTNKLAPRTFACSIDMCGMSRLTDDMAYNLQGGTDLNARYSRDPQSPNYLTPDQQQLRFVGEPTHLEVMKKLGNSSRVIVVHGVQDTACPVADAQEMVANMQAAQLT
ncbi:MAG: prolyl oligopeptidase family serine peptidase, partial [Planctomycetota bacterium]